MTLNDLERHNRPYCAFFSPNSIVFWPELGLSAIAELLVKVGTTTNNLASGASEKIAASTLSAYVGYMMLPVTLLSDYETVT